MESECMGMEEMWLHFVLPYLTSFPVCMRQIRVTSHFHFLTVFPSQFLASFFFSFCLPSVCGDSFCLDHSISIVSLNCFLILFIFISVISAQNILEIHASYFKSTREDVS